MAKLFLVFLVTFAFINGILMAVWHTNKKEVVRVLKISGVMALTLTLTVAALVLIVNLF